LSLPAPVLDDAQRRALAYPLDGALLALTGPAGSGKSTILLRRAELAAARFPGAVLLGSATRRGVARVRESAVGNAGLQTCRIETLEWLALEILNGRAEAAGTSRPEIIDEVRAATLFHAVGAELFSLDWTELPGAELDPEIPGLRAPEFFADAAFRLIRRLRGGLISPAEFRTFCLRGAADFYGKPPNFADATLLMETDKRYRSSLRVSPAELERQRGREIDLVKVLSRLYASYVDSLVARGCMTEVDAVYEATRFLQADENAAARARSRFVCIALDDAQDLYDGQIALLEAIYGASLSGVTLAGDAAQDTREFAGARGAGLLSKAATTIELSEQYRCPPAIVRAAGVVRKTSPVETTVSGEPAVELYRADTLNDETRYVADTVATLLARGITPDRIAVITRNLRSAQPFAGALLARNVPLDMAGEASLYELPATADALGVLWAFYDPYRHDWLLRNLESPWLRLSDASIALLCGEASDPQELLFEIPGDEDGDETRKRWDRRRDVRLARNVTRGDVDAELSAEARTRLEGFRAALLRWETLERSLGLPALVRTILGETTLAALGDDARSRFARGCIERLLREIDAFARRRPLATLGDFLEEAEESAAADSDLLSLEPVASNCVMLLDVEAAKGREYDHVFIIDARAGAFPRYYTPDTFLFTRKWGMIPKENVGDEAIAARTAKFTYALYRLRPREKYNLQERRAFASGAMRARERLYVSASGRATQGRSAPEILEELRAAQPVFQF
jgi:superfamily I DNA/RNA helicase